MYTHTRAHRTHTDCTTTGRQLPRSDPDPTPTGKTEDRGEKSEVERTGDSKRENESQRLGVKRNVSSDSVDGPKLELFTSSRRVES